MAEYRIYFFSTEKVIGRHDFDADSDAIAIQMAQALFDAGSDRSESFDLWQGARHVSMPRLFRNQSGTRSPNRGRDSPERMARRKSRRLLEELENKRRPKPF
jgi:hypothetical protein